MRIPRPFLAILVSMAALWLSVAATAAEPINLQWAKTETGPMSFQWEGIVYGDFEGTLTSTLVSADAAGPILKIEFIWEIETGSEETSFTACATGILNTNIGSVVMNGEVCEGAFLGQNFFDQGQLTGVTEDGRTQFEGSIRIAPNE